MANSLTVMALLTLLHALNVVRLETIRHGGLNRRAVSVSVEAIETQNMSNITIDILLPGTLTDPVQNIVPESCPDDGFHDIWKKKLGKKKYETEMVLPNAFPFYDIVSEFAPSESAAELALQHALVWKDESMNSYRKGGYYDWQKDDDAPIKFRPMVRTYLDPRGDVRREMAETVERITEINKYMFVADVAYIALSQMLSGLLLSSVGEQVVMGMRKFQQMVMDKAKGDAKHDEVGDAEIKQAQEALEKDLPDSAQYDRELAPFYRFGRDKIKLRALCEIMYNKARDKSLPMPEVVMSWGGKQHRGRRKFADAVVEARERIFEWLTIAEEDLLFNYPKSDTQAALEVGLDLLDGPGGKM